MQVYRSIAETGAALRGCAVAIGNFDGVHLGHRALFTRAAELARTRGAVAAALTFEPHPARVLRPEVAPPLLTPLSRKLELLAGCALAATVVQPFTLDYARSTAAEFVGRDLADELGATAVFVGQDFTAGRDRARVDDLRWLLAQRGIELHVVAPVASDGIVASSTKVREFLLEGKVGAAAQLLDRLHDVEGPVLRGAGLGRGLGFATANLRPEAMLPANGVYAIRAIAGSDAAAYDGVCNVGVKPTVQASGERLAEAHLFDHPGDDLYGARIRLSFLARLRDEQRFGSLDELRAQIVRDAAAAREALRHALQM